MRVVSDWDCGFSIRKINWEGFDFYTVYRCGEWCRDFKKLKMAEEYVRTRICLEIIDLR